MDNQVVAEVSDMAELHATLVNLNERTWSPETQYVIDQLIYQVKTTAEHYGVKVE